MGLTGRQRGRSQRLPGCGVLNICGAQVYVLRGGRPVHVEAARRAVIERWNREAEYYWSGGLRFADEGQRGDLLDKVERTIEALRK